MNVEIEEVHEILASTMPQPAQDFQERDPHALVQELLNNNCHYILLGGEIIESFSGSIILFVEEDIKLIMKACIQLEELAVKDECYQHGTCLVDYRFSMTAYSDKDDVTFELEYSPDGTSEGLIHQVIHMSNNEYLWWWRSLASGIEKILANYHALPDKNNQ
jgi:hypothetical protein